MSSPAEEALPKAGQFADFSHCLGMKTHPEDTDFRMLELAEAYNIFHFNLVFYRLGSWGPEWGMSLPGVTQQIIPIGLI